LHAFEAYLRNAITMNQSPMLVLREYQYTQNRRDLIQKYVDVGAMIDPVVINMEAAFAPFKDLDESIVPLGFQDWIKFGGPDGAPGKTRSNLSLQQHDLIGNMLAMYFLGAAELVMAQRLGTVPKDAFNIGPAAKPNYKHYLIPSPKAPDLESDALSKDNTMLFGSPVPADQSWYMNDLHCRTSFDPVVSGGLDEIIVSGTDAEDIDLLLPKGRMLYNSNWVLDYDTVSKTLASGLEQYNLGYQDRRKGYFGVKPSGNLTMFLPLSSNDAATKQETQELLSKKPNQVYKNVVVCEVNERAECKIGKDLAFVLGGSAVEATSILANGVSYNSRKICVALDIPDSVSWSFRNTEKKDEDRNLRQKRSRSSSEESGLLLQVSVSNSAIFWKDGPCSISHVVWEQFRAQP